MKDKNNVIKALLVVIIICLIAAILIVLNVDKKNSVDEPSGELVSITELVTDNQGETVTDANGEVVTEIVEAEVVTEAGGEVVTEVVTAKNKQPVTNKNGTKVTQAVTKKPSKPTTTTKKGKTTTTKKGQTPTSTTTTTKADKPSNVVTQPNAPDKVSGFKSSDVKKDSVKLSWNKLDCDGYEIQYKKKSQSWDNAEQELTSSTNITIKKLTSYTEYNIRIRGYRKYAGSMMASPDGWVELTVKTKPDEDTEKKLNVEYTIPILGYDDTLEIYVKKDGDKEKGEKDSTVEIKAGEARVATVETAKKYKGLVQVQIKLKKANMESKPSKFSDKANFKLEIRNSNIDVVNGIDD